MNDINLINILKDCPKGWKLYSPLFGEVYFKEICNDDECATIITKSTLTVSFTKEGFYYADEDGECLLFPSKEQRDWSKFTAPWYKKERFDPKTLKAFDMVLVKMKEGKIWYADIISVSANENKLDYCTITIGDADYDWVIPYNDDTKHLVGTTEEAPEFYRYWEE